MKKKTVTKKKTVVYGDKRVSAKKVLQSAIDGRSTGKDVVVVGCGISGSYLAVSHPTYTKQDFDISIKLLKDAIKYLTQQKKLRPNAVPQSPASPF